MMTLLHGDWISSISCCVSQYTSSLYMLFCTQTHFCPDIFYMAGMMVTYISLISHNNWVKDVQAYQAPIHPLALPSITTPPPGCRYRSSEASYLRLPSALIGYSHPHGSICFLQTSSVVCTVISFFRRPRTPSRTAFHHHQAVSHECRAR